jgi:hypothetical protein
MQLEPLDTVLEAGSTLTLVLSQAQQHDRTPVMPPVPPRSRSATSRAPSRSTRSP